MLQRAATTNEQTFKSLGALTGLRPWEYADPTMHTMLGVEVTSQFLGEVNATERRKSEILETMSAIIFGNPHPTETEDATVNLLGIQLDPERHLREVTDAHREAAAVVATWLIGNEKSENLDQSAAAEAAAEVRSLAEFISEHLSQGHPDEGVDELIEVAIAFYESYLELFRELKEAAGSTVLDEEYTQVNLTDAALEKLIVTELARERALVNA